MANRFERYPIFWLAIAFLFCTAGAVVAQPAGVRIGGSVVDQLGHVLPGVTVTLEPAGTLDARAGVLATTTTDVLGRFAFENIAPGAYVVAPSDQSGVFRNSVGTSIGLRVGVGL